VIPQCRAPGGSCGDLRTGTASLRSLENVLCIPPAQDYQCGGSTFTLKTEEPGGGQVVRGDVSTLPTLFEPYADTFEQGLRVGAEELKQYLQELVRRFPPHPKWESAVPQPRPQQGQQPSVQPGQRAQPGLQVGQRPQQPAPLFMHGALPGQ
jgi:hypothetical protein